jgi:acetylornithine deacetylase/succinyl-diaminopimelate desuccinylase-like protein
MPSGTTFYRMDLQAEATDVLSQLIRFDTVNPPGNERACQEWLKRYLEDAGLECELLWAEDHERPNLVARLRGEAEGPVLGYLSHVDTVLADASDWRRDPWSGEVHDGALWGRGAVDMKSQTAAEAVAAAHLARQGWRPPHGELKVISVVDEETGGRLGAQWLTEQRPDAARVDWLLNEGGGAVMPYGERRLYGVCCAEKGTFRFRVRARGRAGHASVPALADNALLKLVPALERLGNGLAAYDVVDEPRAFLEAIGEDPADPAGAVERMRATEPRLAALLEPTLGATFAPTLISAGEKINVIPARAEFAVDCRLPPGLDGDVAIRRVHEVLGDVDGLEIDFTESVVGNRSPIASPLMDAIAAWVGEADPGGEAVPVVLPAFTDSRWFRAAFPECVAYGFFPQRHQTLYESWPLMHSADERLDVRDIGFATAFFTDLPRRLLT